MNLQPLFKTQDQLDQRIIKQHGLEGQDLLPQKILALQVELGECANEWRGFKFWSKAPFPKPPQHNWRASEDGMNQEWRPEWGYESYPLLEEYVDCLHFILSIGNRLKFYDGEFCTSHKDDVTEQFSYTFQKISDLGRCLSLGNYEMMFCSFLALGDYLGFSWEQIEQAYFAKNEINHSRQDTGY